MNPSSTQKRSPQNHKVGSVTVSVFDETQRGKPKFRVRWYVGKNRESETFRSLIDAETFAKAKAVELNNECRPPSGHALAELSRKAILFDEAALVLQPYNWQPLPAIYHFQSMLKEMGDEGVRLFAHLYGPRLAQVRKLPVSDAIKAFKEFEETSDQVSEDHRKNRNRCFVEFDKSFGPTLIHQVEAADLDIWLQAQNLQAETWNKWLYAIRSLFCHARDYLKALPQILPTECELVRSRIVEHKQRQVLTLPELVRIGGSLPDQETLLAFALVLFGHLRQEEAEKLRAEHFRPGPLGMPDLIYATNEVVKRKKGEDRPRDIVIKPNLGRILAVLLPKEGALFPRKNVFSRVRRIIRHIGITWTGNMLRRSCTSYSIANAEPMDQVAKSSGHSVTTLKRKYLVPVAPQEASKYWRLTFNTNRIQRLPRRYQIPGEKIKRPKKALAPPGPDSARPSYLPGFQEIMAA